MTRNTVQVGKEQRSEMKTSYDEWHCESIQILTIIPDKPPPALECKYSKGSVEGLLSKRASVRTNTGMIPTKSKFEAI
jgi:hypothetical protein